MAKRFLQLVELTDCQVATICHFAEASSASLFFRFSRALRAPISFSFSLAVLALLLTPLTTPNSPLRGLDKDLPRLSG